MFTLVQALKTIHDLVLHGKLMEFYDYINTLTDEQRILVRETLEEISPSTPLPRNLYYNYKTQRWIER